MKLTAKYILWTLFIVGALASSIASYFYFPKAFPIIHLNITMNRTQAVEAAKIIALENNLAPQHTQITTSFATDEKVKTFVELEGGGKQALVDMIDNNLYQPYTWHVRLFKPFEHREATIIFTPDGAPYGFKEKLSENEKTENISKDLAQKKAVQFITAKPWSIILSDYTLVETSQETVPSGRIDHSFVYERAQQKIGDGFYRLGVVVSGDHVSELNHFVKVPEQFMQRYQEMRSKNENIGYLGNLLMIVLYGIGCCFLGLFYLIRKRLLLWKKGLLWGMIISATIALTTVNKLPLYWMQYNTSHSPTNFLLQMGIGILSMFIFLTIIFSLIFTTAEGLTRAAFPNQIQFWKLFNTEVASSYSVLGYTIGGYLLAPFLLLYVILFYVWTTSSFNWWMPTSALFNPDILATYFPWLESIAPSFQAGFFEECLFRALPLASAALLGKRFGKKNWWIAGAFILQIFIFGAAHAEYPTQPAYARLIETIFVCSVWGGIYLRFGLLPSIISHFAYDVFLFALPVIVSTASGALANKIIIALLSLTPAWIVLYARLKKGAWHPISEKFLNKSWHPTTTPKIIEAPTSTKQQSFMLPKLISYAFLCMGIVSMGTWLVTTRFQSDAPQITLTRQQALQKAAHILKGKNVEVTEWKAIADPMIDVTIIPSLNKQHRFIWQEEQPWYKKLIGSYLAPPHWIVRYAKFNGSLNDRAEEHLLYFNPDGSLMRYVHKLPEIAPGKSLSRTESVAIAQQEIKKRYGLLPNSLQEISAQSKKQPNRVDWTIIYKNINNYSSSEGEARITVSLAGDQVVDAYRFIHVPEDWERKEENNLLLASIIIKLCQLCIYLLAVASSVFALRRWGALHISTPLALLIGLAAISLFELFNAYPTIIFKFVTSQPFADQLFRSFGITAVILILRATVIAIILSFVTTVPQQYYIPITNWLPFIGISIGAFFAGSNALLSYLLPSKAPTWANYKPLKFLSPASNALNYPLLNYLIFTTLFLFGIIMIQSIKRVKHNKSVGVLLFIILGFIGAGLSFSDNLPLFATSGLVMGAGFWVFYYSLLQYNYAIIPLATGTYIVLDQLQEALFNSYSSSILLHAIVSILIMMIAWIWYKKLISNRSPSVP